MSASLSATLMYFDAFINEISVEFIFSRRKNYSRTWSFNPGLADVTVNQLLLLSFFEGEGGGSLCFFFFYR